MMEWIRVDDEKPKKPGKLLAVGQTRSIMNQLRERSVQKCEYNADGEWLLNGNYYLENVTHWQPLPDLPKGNDDER